jgi:hypothetical protein
LNPIIVSNKYPILERNRALSAITNPTLKNKFEDGIKGTTPNANDICICLRLSEEREK